MRIRQKTFGRIVVPKAHQIKTVRKLIELLDPFEFVYLGGDVITYLGDEDGMAMYPVADGIPVVYLGKFEIDKEQLALACLLAGVPVAIIDGLKQDERIPIPEISLSGLPGR